MKKTILNYRGQLYVDAGNLLRFPMHRVSPPDALYDEPASVSELPTTHLFREKEIARDLVLLRLHIPNTWKASEFKEKGSEKYRMILYRIAVPGWDGLVFVRRNQQVSKTGWSVVVYPDKEGNSKDRIRSLVTSVQGIVLAIENNVKTLKKKRKVKKD